MLTHLQVMMPEAPCGAVGRPCSEAHSALMAKAGCKRHAQAHCPAQALPCSWQTLDCLSFNPLC